MISLLLVTHFVADFLMQPRWMGKKKSEDPAILAAHCGIHLVMFMLCLLPFYGMWTAIVFAWFNALIHGAIDWYIWRLYKLTVRERFPDATPETFKPLEDPLFLHTIGFDQLLHGLTLVGLAGLLL